MTTGCTTFSIPPSDSKVKEQEISLTRAIESAKTLEELQSYIISKSGEIRKIEQDGENLWDVSIPLFQNDEMTMATVAKIKIQPDGTLHTIEVVTFTLH